MTHKQAIEASLKRAEIRERLGVPIPEPESSLIAAYRRLPDALDRAYALAQRDAAKTLPPLGKGW